MLTLSTNLVVWMTAVTEESLHQTTVPDYPENITKLSKRSEYIVKGNRFKRLNEIKYINN